MVNFSALSLWLVGVIGLFEAGKGLALPDSPQQGRIAVIRETRLISVPEGSSLQPEVLAPAHGGYIIAGSIPSRQQAWVTKIDEAGHQVWSQVVAAQAGLPPGERPHFLGATTISNGTTFLCGDTPVKRGMYAPAMLVQLSNSGDVMASGEVTPNGKTEHGTAVLRKSIEYHTGVLFVGTVTQVNDGATTKAGVESFYWIHVVDGIGKVLFDKLYPSMIKVPINITSFDRDTREGLIFTVNNNDQTEVVRISSDLLHLDSKLISGRYILVKGVNDDVHSELIGDDRRGHANTITLGESLELVQSRDVGYEPQKFSVSFAFRVRSKLTLVIGSSINDNGVPFTSKILLLDGNLSPSHSLKLDQGSGTDLGRVLAATAVSAREEFLVARTLVNHAPSGISGASLDLLQLQ